MVTSNYKPDIIIIIDVSTDFNILEGLQEIPWDSFIEQHTKKISYSLLIPNTEIKTTEIGRLRDQKGNAEIQVTTSEP